jgi:hypothetical protein
MAKVNKESFNEMLEKLKSESIVTGKQVEAIEERRYFLIVCEGKRTEPIYFEYIQNLLPKDLMRTIQIEGEGDNTMNLVREAIRKRNERLENALVPAYDEVWAVFDKDDFPNENYDNAVSMALANNIECGISNQSFELWYILHFELLEAALHRKDYISRLSQYLGFKYNKNDRNVVKFLFSNGNVKQAISWAKRLEKIHDGKTPSESCPYTRVYVLVERLLEYSKYKL